MTMVLIDDFRYATRSLVRRPAVTIFAAVTLALGIGATTAIFGALEGVVLNPVPYEHGDRMVGLFARLGASQSLGPPQPAQLERWRQQRDLFDAVEQYQVRSMTLTGQGEPEALEVALVQPSFHALIGVFPTVGRPFDGSATVGDGERVLLLSFGLARRMAGRAAEAIGATLTLDGEPWTVVGVMPRGALLPGWGLNDVDAWRPLPESVARTPTAVVGLLREGVSVGEVNARLAALDQDQRGSGGVGLADPVRDQISRGSRGYFTLLMGAVVLLLLIACVNVSNLLLFRANARKRETALRAALGGGRARLARQMFIECVLLAVVGGVMGMGVADLGQVAIMELRPDRLEVLGFVSINTRVLVFALAITFGSGLVFGMIPAVQAGRADVITPLRDGGRTAGNVVGSRLRWLLVTGEIGLSLALLIWSLSILGTLFERQRVEYGYAVDDIAIMTVTAPSWRYGTPAGRTAVFDAISERLVGLPNVVGVSRASGVPPQAGVLFGTIQVEGRVATEEIKELHGPRVREDYFSTVGQPILRGRPILAADLTSAEPVLILGESTARILFPDRDPVGARLRIADQDAWSTVVGVAADVPMDGLSDPGDVLQVYLPMRSDRARSTFIVRLGTDGDPRSLGPVMRQTAHSVDPQLLVDRVADGLTLQRDTLERERFATTIMSVLAMVALVLASIGLYGVVSQIVGQRTREIGIRIALGARRAAIAAMVLRDVGAATVAGIGVGVILAAAGTQVLRSRVFGFEEGSPAVLALASGTLGLVAFVAAYAPARRAMRVDPLDALRVE